MISLRRWLLVGNQMIRRNYEMTTRSMSTEPFCLWQKTNLLCVLASGHVITTYFTIFTNEKVHVHGHAKIDPRVSIRSSLRPKIILNMEKMFFRKLFRQGSTLWINLTLLMSSHPCWDGDQLPAGIIRPLPSQTAHVYESSDDHMDRADCDCAEDSHPASFLRMIWGW